METSLFVSGYFPYESTVKAYLASGWPAGTILPTGVPIGEVVASDVIDGETSTVFLSGLTADTKYFVGCEVEGTWRYMVLRTVVPGDSRTYDPERQTHETETKGAHGIADTKALLTKPESPTAFTQTYSTASHVHAKGALATNLPTNLNIVTTLLGTLVTEVNTSNARTNQIAEAVNEIKQVVNGLVDDLQAQKIVG